MKCRCRKCEMERLERWQRRINASDRLYEEGLLVASAGEAKSVAVTIALDLSRHPKVVKRGLATAIGELAAGDLERAADIIEGLAEDVSEWQWIEKCEVVQRTDND